MLEQIVTSIAIVFLNLALYIHLYGKIEPRVKVVCLTISFFVLFISFSINFNPELFLPNHNLFLVMFSCSLPFAYVLIKLYQSFMLPLLITFLPKSEYADTYFNLVKMMLKAAPVLFHIGITFIQFQLIWNLKDFNELANSL